MSIIDDRASRQIKTVAQSRGLKQNQLCPVTGISRSAMSRIFRGNRSQLSVGEYIALHQAMGNNPASQLQQLIDQANKPGTSQRFIAVEYSRAAIAPLATGDYQLITTELGYHYTEQLAIQHAKTLLPVTENINTLLMGGSGQRWIVFTATELANLQKELK